MRSRRFGNFELAWLPQATCSRFQSAAISWIAVWRVAIIRRAARPGNGKLLTRRELLVGRS